MANARRRSPMDTTQQFPLTRRNMSRGFDSAVIAGRRASVYGEYEAIPGVSGNSLDTADIPEAGDQVPTTRGATNRRSAAITLGATERPVRGFSRLGTFSIRS